MLCHSDMLDFVPDTGMETLPMYEEIFDLGEELTFEDLRAAEMSQPKNATQAEVRAEFYKNVVLPAVTRMYGWANTNADLAVRHLFDKTVRDYVMNPETYLSELDGYEYNGTKIVFTEPKVMVHFIYSGVPISGEESKVHQEICSASHFSTKNTNRCGDAAWHTHSLIIMPIKYSQNKHSYELKEDARTIRVRHFRYFVSTFGRRECIECIGLSKSANRTRILRCTNKECGKYVKYNGKWNVKAVLNGIRYVLRRKLEGRSQKKWVFQGTTTQRLKRFKQVKYPRNHTRSMFASSSTVTGQPKQGNGSTTQKAYC